MGAEFCLFVTLTLFTSKLQKANSTHQVQVFQLTSIGRCLWSEWCCAWGVTQHKHFTSLLPHN